MKKAFSWLLSISLGMLLLITSCTNASQITFADESKGNFTDSGYSVVTVQVGSMPDYTIEEELENQAKLERTAFPQDWTPDLMKLVIYELKATPTKPDASLTKATEAATGLKFTYEQIQNGEAKMELDPVEWNFTLDAYQPQKDNAPSTGNYDAKKHVLHGEAQNINLADGGAPVLFNMEPVVEHDSTATGNIDINLYFYNEDELHQLDIKTLVSVGGDEVATKPTFTPMTDFTNSGDSTQVGKNENYRKVHYSGAISVGTHIFTANFTDVNGKEKLKYEETVVIDGGNTTHKDIYIPQGSYNRAPNPAIGLTAKTVYAPDVTAENLLKIKESEQFYARETDDLKVLSTDKYNVILNWTDKAFNEAGFKITFDIFSPDTAKLDGQKNVVITYNKSGTPDVTGTGSSSVSIIKEKGDLRPSSETATISLPTGIFCKNIRVSGFNTWGTTQSDPIANDSVISKENAVSKEQIEIAKPIGLFTVAYNLDAPGTTSNNAVVTYNIAGGKTSLKYFVVGYNYGDDVTETIKFRGQSAVYPFIYHDKYHFSGWYHTVGKPEASSSVLVEKINDTKLKDEVKGYDKLNQNIEVKGSWTSTATVQINFPSYNGLKELQVSNQLMGEVMYIDYNKTGTIGLPAGANDKVTELKYVIYRPAIDSETSSQILATVDGMTGSGVVDGITYDTSTKGITISPKTLVTTSANNAVGGIYRIYMSYKYDDTDGTGKTNVPIDGNLYVRISNDNKN